MARILAIDYGTKRVGLAVTDPLQIIATALETVHSKDLISFLEKYFASEEVETIVIGEPKTLSNEETHSSEEIKKLKIHLERKFESKKVVMVDERFTSKIAFQGMIDGGMRKKDRQKKENLDKLSAVVILQSYMEMR